MTPNVISIDPSMHSTGVAYFENEKLKKTFRIKVSKDFTKEKAVYEMVSMFHETVFGSMPRDHGSKTIWVVEEQVYRGQQEKMSIENFKYLAALTYILGYENYPRSVLVQPSVWKGSVPKDIHNKRVYENELELGSPLIHYATMENDILDAIGIGRWYYGHIKKTTSPKTRNQD